MSFYRYSFPLPILHHFPSHLTNKLTPPDRSFLNLPSRTRLYIGLGMIGWAGLGMLLTDKAEEKFGLVPTEKDREELERAVPRVRRVGD